MNKKLIEQLNGYINPNHINNAKEYQNKDIKLVKMDMQNRIKGYTFRVLRKDNIFGKQYATVKITMYGNILRSVYCDCYVYGAIHSCEHIPAAIMNYTDFTEKENIQSVSKFILEEFSQKRTNKIKKKLNVQYQLEVYNEYHLNVYLKFKIGYDKLYMINGSKYRHFMEVYESGEGTLELGKNFSYDPSLYYFSSEDEEILNFISNNCLLRFESICFDNYSLVKFLSFFKNKDFFIKDIGMINGIKEEVPFKINLNKKDDVYKLNINYKDIEALTENYEYIIYNEEVYHLNKGYQKLLKSLIDNNIKTLEFKKEEIPIFNNGILPIIKNELKVASNLQEINSILKPSVKLYFDIFDDYISCNIKLIYGDKEIDYFDEVDNILRDIEFENEVLNDLINIGFVVDNNKLILTTLELIVLFLEEKINELTTKYEIYTSEKLKNTNIRKKVNINSNFSIGQDNIMHYTFAMDDLSEEEMANLLNSLRKNKKYHKLKNGDIVSLEDENIKELNNLMEDLNLSYNEFNGEIPKYQAIYLDYLKKEKYPNIKTNNLFTEFINKFNTHKDEKLLFTKNEKNILRPYQIEGVEWLYNIHKCDLGGILADEMGLGKTIQTIYFFKKLKKEDKKSKFLVVCPTSLVYNWLKEFQTFGSDLSVSILSGYKTLRKKLLEEFDSDIYITSYGTLREDKDLYEKLNFKVCVIDEAQYIKNPFAKITRAVKEIKADTKIALTGTPLENSIVELWSIFDFIMPGYLNNISKFNEKYSFKDEDESQLEKINNLKILTAPFILRRKKNEVVKELPLKYENIIYVDLDEEQKKIYALEVQKVKNEIDNLLKVSSFKEKQFQILTLLTRLRQICVDPKLIYENYKGNSAKIERLIATISENALNGHKMLMFTTFKSVLDIIKKELDKNKITYYTIDGSVSSKDRQILVDNFNKDETNVFLITLRSGGTGLNLTSADIVIHLDLWWNPQVENQATDRAHRIGQTKSVEVIKLVASGTIEERILELQQKKKVLADRLIEKGHEGNIQLSSLTEDDIKNLIDFDNKSTIKQ